MTAVLPAAGDVQVPARTRPGQAAARAAVGRRRWLDDGWPIGLAVAGYPIWWAVGVTALVFPAAAAVLLAQLVRRGRIHVPPGFGIWLLFLVVVLASAVMLDQTAPGTLPPEGFGRYLAYGARLVNYASVAVLMLYLGNTSEAQLPRLRVIRWMALLAVWTVLLGLLSLALPEFSFRTLLSTVLPGNLGAVIDGQGGRVSLAQVQPVLGIAAPRPAAPFAFTNAWGSSLSLLLVWLVVAGWAGGRRARLAVGAVVAVSVVPIVYSLNRGMWIGLGLSLGYIALRLALRGRLLAIGALLLALGVASALFVASPLERLVSERLQNGHSNDIRGSLASEAVAAAATSPLLGYGSTRSIVGSQNSIAVGRSATCPRCGNSDIGSTGQVFLLLVAQGFVGLGLYVAYFLRSLWAYRHDASPVGLAGTLVVLLSLFYGFFYTALLMPLAVTFLSLGLLWRNALLRQQQHEPVARARGR